MMALTVNQGFEAFLGRLTPSKTERAAGASHRASVRAVLESNFKVFNFFESGSFSHGTGVRGFSDIDAFVSLDEPKPGYSYSPLEWVKDVLTTRFPLTTMTISRPAVVVHFGAGYETWEIIPAFPKAVYRGAIVYNIPGPSIGSGWIASAPKLHLNYANACNEYPSHGKAKALARLIKAWKYYNDVPISSFYLEMRCAQHVSGVANYFHIVDVWFMLQSLWVDDLIPMEDPTGATGWVHACSTESNRSAALTKLLTAAVQAKLALDADNEGKPETAFYHLNNLFRGNFPAR